MRKLTRAEKDMIYIALGLRENLIETGSPHIDAATVERMGEKNAASSGAKLKALSVDQMELLIASKKLKALILSDNLMIADT